LDRLTEKHLTAHVLPVLHCRIRGVIFVIMRCINWYLHWRWCLISTGFQKTTQSLCTIILQPLVTETCGMHQNVQKLIDNTTKSTAVSLQLNILCLATGK